LPYEKGDRFYTQRFCVRNGQALRQPVLKPEPKTCIAFLVYLAAVPVQRSNCQRLYHFFAASAAVVARKITL
jgi:hypothetical protein